MIINFCDFDGFFGKYRAISANTRSTRRCIPGGLEWTYPHIRCVGILESIETKSKPKLSVNWFTALIIS